MIEAPQKANKHTAAFTIILQYISVGILFSLSLHFLEIILSSLNYEYKILSTKILSFSLVYLGIGLLAGLFLAASAFAASRWSRRREALRRYFSPACLASTCLLWFYSFAVLNAAYLSTISLLSPDSIFLNAAIIISSFPIMILLKRFGRLDGEPLPVAKAGSAAVSLAIALTCLHAWIRPRLAQTQPGMILLSLVILSYLLFPSLIVIIENNLLKRLRSKEGGSAETRRYGIWLLVKSLAMLIVLAVFVVARYPRPLAASGGIESGAAIPEAPNIIMIVLDTVRQDRLSLYGCARKTTPNIDAFAREALVFDGYSSSHWTLPSHASLVTGLYPTENGTHSESYLRLDESNETLSEIFSRHGYRTGAVIANSAVLGPESGMPQGFHFYFTDIGEFLPAFHFFAGYFVRKFSPDSRIFLAERFLRAAVVNKRALQWVRQDSAQPFFLLLNYMDAHALYLPPPPYDTMWSNQKSLLHLFHPESTFEKYRNEIIAGARRLSEDERAYLVGQYDGAISYMDEQIGKLLENLKEMRLYDNTLIIITSDHGELFGEHELMEHKGSLYQELIRVPLIVKLPAGTSAPATGKPPGRVSSVHLFGFILQAARIAHRSNPNRADIFQGQQAPVIAESHVRGALAEKIGTHIYCLIRNDLKLIISSNGKKELFDIEEDPREEANLKVQHSGEWVSSADEIEFALISAVEQLNANALQPKVIDTDKDERIREKLKALGYLN